MSTSYSLIIKVFLILSVLFVSSSAQFPFLFPRNDPIQEEDPQEQQKQEQEQEQENNEENAEAATHPRPGIPKFPPFPGLPGFNLPIFGPGNGNQQDQEQNGGVGPENPDEKPEPPKHFQPSAGKRMPLPQPDEQPKPQPQPQPEPEPEQPKPQPQPEQPQPLPQQPQPEQPKPQPQQPEQPKPLPEGEAPLGLALETNFLGKWELVSPNSGVSAMHSQLMPTNKVVMFDATSLGKSSIELPRSRCRLIPNTTNLDCFAHAVEYDIVTNKVKTLKVETNPWCSSGGLGPDGTLVNTGGWEEGEKSIRYYNSCPRCDWRESKIKLSDVRWYGSQAQLGDGRYVLIGGRRSFSYEFLAPENQPSPGRIDLPFLLETTDLHENNLYPFAHLAPDGNLFLLANYKSILLDVRTNKIVRKYPDLLGGARNYPGSATTAIIPINLQNGEENVDIEVLVCGGGQPLAFGKAEKEGIYLPALDTCGRIKVLDPKANWEMEKMPAARVMSDCLNLPNGDILMLNGAKKGASGWTFADDPNFTPYLYSPNKPNGQRIKVMAATTIPRMYHSSSVVLPDGRILVGGSNTNPGYQFVNVKFPTELRVEKFSPPYLDPALQPHQPKLLSQPNKVILYGQNILLDIAIAAGDVLQKDILVTMYQPPFTTHGYSMNQRLLVLKIVSFHSQGGHAQLQFKIPSKGELAPPGFYLIFVNCHGVPSVGSWVQLK